MRKLKWLATILGTILVSILPAVAVLAANPMSVTMVNTPQFTNGISSFTVTYVSDTEMDLNWTLDTNSAAQNIMIRAKYGSYPANIPNENTAPTDGYLVFYGDGTATTSAMDTSMDMNQNAGTLYYTAWAQKADGTWYVQTHTGSEESREMVLITIVVLTLALTVTAFILQQGIGKGMLSMVCVIFWLITGFMLYNTQWNTGNTYFPYALLLGCLAMVIVMIVYTLNVFIFSRQDHTPALTDEQEQAAYKQQIYKLTKKKDKAPW